MRFSLLPIVVATSVLVLDASAQFPLIGVTNTLWRYLATGVDPGQDWAQAGFDDSSWPAGRGLFGTDFTVYPYPFNTPVPVPGQGGPLTVYYRTQFQWAGSVAGVTLSGTNHVDDGCIVYLNGVEISRFNMPQGPVDSSTSALAANPGGEPVAVPMWISLGNLTNGNPNPLAMGANVLAVEVHQAGSGSSDHVFGLSLQTTPDFSCGIVEHPASQVVTACRTATFTVVPHFECFNPSYQWFFELPGGQAIPLPGANQSSLVLTDVQFDDIGFYFCRLTSISGTLESQRASLDVNPDTEPPRLLYGYIPTAYGNELRLVFDEPIQLPEGGTPPSGWNVSAWHDDIVGIPCTVYAVHVTNRSEVALFIAQAIEPRYYFWVESSHELSDRCGGNILGGGIAESCLDLIQALDPSDLRIWRYHDTGLDPGPDWMQPSFDDTAWKSGPQVFDSDPARQTVEGWSVRTRLAVDISNSSPPQRIPTFLFRVRLNLPNDFRAYSIVGRAIHDDGFVLYVNGQEAFRRGVSNDQFDAFGDSNEPTGNTIQQPFIVSGSNLVAGDNVIAVQLKQANAWSADATLGLQLQLLGVHIYPTPEIFDQPDSQTVTEGHGWFMQVVSSGWSHQWFHNGVPIPGATGTRLTGVARPTDAGAYHVEADSLFGSVTSDTATLQVRPVTLGYSATWRYQTNQQDATLTATPWYAPTFDDSSWPAAPGPFGRETTAATSARLPSPIVTPLPVPSPGFRTVYFRTRVTIPPTPAGQTLMLCHVVDDGAAFYVDGQPAFRYNLTNALPIYSTNAATTSVPGDGDAQIVCTPFPLEAGEHLLAFEVHQAAGNSTDVIAGLELRLVTPPAPTSIEIQRDDSGHYFLEWNPDPFWELVQSSQLSGPYSRVSGDPLERFTPPPATTNRFFQLRFNGR